MERTEQVSLRFERGAAGAEQLQAVVDEVLVDLQDATSGTSRVARQAQLDTGVLAGARVQVTEEKQGLEPIATTILVTIAAKVGAHIVEKFWDDVVWPRIKVRLGADALGDKRS